MKQGHCKPFIFVEFGPALLLALTTVSMACATGPRACSITVIPAGATAATNLQEAAALAEGECTVLSPEQLLALLPPDRVSDPAARRAEVLGLLTRGENDFYGENRERGRESLLAGFQALRQEPSLLPEGTDEREALYRALLIVLRIEWEREKMAGDGVAHWLAAHMPEQVPSVKRLPPVVAGRASAALEETRRDAVKLSAPLPKDCRSGRLRLDGVILGELPIVGRSIPRGRHAIRFECIDKHSWVRTMLLTEETTLVSPEVGIEHLLSLRPTGMILLPGIPGQSPERLGARLAVSLNVDAVLVMPADGTSPASLAGPAGETEVPFDAGQGRYRVTSTQVFHPHGQWKRTAKWTSLLAALILGAGGATANMFYLAHIDSMQHGTVDRRGAAESWKTAGIAGYSAAGAAAAAAITLFVLEALPPEPVEPVF